MKQLSTSKEWPKIMHQCESHFNQDSTKKFTASAKRNSTKPIHAQTK